MANFHIQSALNNLTLVDLEKHFKLLRVLSNEQTSN